MYLVSIGAAVPRLVDSSWAQRRGLLRPEAVDWGYRSVAVAGERPAPEMATAAGQLALDRAGWSGAEVDDLFYAPTWHQGPEGWLPHSYLQRELDLDRSNGYEIRLGCNGLLGAAALAESSRRTDRTRVMLAAADNYGTPKYDRWTMGNGFLSGDAGIAVCLDGREGFAEVASIGAAQVPSAEALNRGARPLFPPDITVGEGIDFDRRQEEFLSRATAKGRAEAQLAMAKVQAKARSVVEDTLESAGVEGTQVDHFIYMNYARPVVEQLCETVAGLDARVARVFPGDHLGHCGSSDHFLTLLALVLTRQVEAGDRVLLVGIGPGVSVHALMLRICFVPEWTSPTSEGLQWLV